MELRSDAEPIGSILILAETEAEGKFITWLKNYTQNRG